MSKKQDVVKLAEYCEENLDLNSSELDEGYGYPSVPLCVIDAVFSIGVTYVATQNTVNRFCAFFDIPMSNENSPLSIEDQLSISQLIGLYDKHGISKMAEKVFQNRNRTSSRSGILKTEAVLRFSQVLKSFEVDYLQDMDKVVGNPEFEADIQKIPGQKSGISLRYFYMLAGNKNYIKPDRMIIRFITAITGKTPSIEDATRLLVDACNLLTTDHPNLSPRMLDNLIWNYQREQ